MDVSVTIDGDVLDSAVKEKNSFNCKRRKIRFDFENGEWRYGLSCGGYGNGYGVGFSCKETCDLRITDLTKCKEIKTEFGYYLKQVNVFGKMNENLNDYLFNVKMAFADFNSDYYTYALSVQSLIERTGSKEDVSTNGEYLKESTDEYHELLEQLKNYLDRYYEWDGFYKENE